MNLIYLASSLACGPAETTSSTSLPTIGLDTAEIGPVFVEPSEDGRSVLGLEPARYLGLWYEIATTPSQQQAACAGTTAEYSFTADGVIGVDNRCRLGGLEGSLNQIKGTARPIDDTFARLLVDFGFGFEAPYTVIELVDVGPARPYEVSVVQGLGEQYWILAREPTLDPTLADTVWDQLARRGIDLDRLLMTEQTTNP